jgi:hypothetical protein
MKRNLFYGKSDLILSPFHISFSLTLLLYPWRRKWEDGCCKTEVLTGEIYKYLSFKKYVVGSLFLILTNDR